MALIWYSYPCSVPKLTLAKVQKGALHTRKLGNCVHTQITVNTKFAEYLELQNHENITTYLLCLIVQYPTTKFPMTLGSGDSTPARYAIIRACYSRHSRLPSNHNPSPLTHVLRNVGCLE